VLWISRGAVRYSHRVTVGPGVLMQAL